MCKNMKSHEAYVGQTSILPVVQISQLNLLKLVSSCVYMCTSVSYTLYVHYTFTSSYIYQAAAIIAVNLLVSNTLSVLHSREGHLNIVRYLVTEAHCDPNIKDNDGWTPLHYACR